MTLSTKQTVALAVNDRLKAVAKKMAGDPNLNASFVHTRYVYERLLARLQKTSAAGNWVLKGGVLMLTLPQEVHRVTMDADFSLRNGKGMSFTGVLGEICSATPDQEDGMTYELVTDGKDAPRMMREEALNPTARGKLIAVLHCPRPNDRRFTVDVTQAEMLFEPTVVEWHPTVKGFDPIMVPSYPWELVLAEKLHSVITGSIANPRLRDYMDVLALSRSGVIDAAKAADYLVKVFETRGHANLFALECVGLCEHFGETRQRDWAGTLARTGYLGHLPDLLSDAIAMVRDVALPLMRPAAPVSTLVR